MLRSLGIEPEVRGSMPGALERLRRGRLAAVLIDRGFTRVDPLEFILNVRDIEAAVPVVVIGSANDEFVDRQIRRQRCTAVVDGVRNMDLLAEELVRVLDEFKDLRQAQRNQSTTSGSSDETA
jgi:hypothetical protein